MTDFGSQGVHLQPEQVAQRSNRVDSDLDSSLGVPAPAIRGRDPAHHPGERVNHPPGFASPGTVLACRSVGGTMSRLRDHFFSEPPHTPPYVIEDTTSRPSRRLVTMLGIEWMATPTAWIAPVWVAAVGIVIGLFVESGAAGQRVLLGLVYGVLIGASVVLHQLGGALAGWLVGAPMLQVTFTATLAYNAYDESREYPSRVHVIRGLGEPVANLILGAVMLGLYWAGLHANVVLVLAVLNLVFFVVAMAPFPTMHGGVVLKHLRSWKAG